MELTTRGQTTNVGFRQQDTQGITGMQKRQYSAQGQASLVCASLTCCGDATPVLSKGPRPPLSFSLYPKIQIQASLKSWTSE